jgi:hypothetical protein
MRYKNIKPRIKISYALCILFVLFGIASANAQPECKRKLNTYNQRDIPTGQLTEFVNCLTTMEAYLLDFNTQEQKNKDKITELKGALNQNRNLLTQAKQARDSTGIDTYTKKEIELNKDLETLNRTVPNRNEYLASKSVLSDSYKKIIAYYDKIEDPKAREYERKLNALNASN